MSKLKAAILAAAATFAFASPSRAQNFHGFGAPSYVTAGNTAQSQDKPVALKTHRVEKRVAH